MARRYRRRNKQAEDPLSGLITFIIVAGGLWFWYATRENKDLLIIGLVILALLVGITAYLMYRHFRYIQQRTRALDIAAIDTMDPLLFEEYIAKLLRHRGYTNVALTDRYDYGVDIIAEKDGTRWGIQVKRYSGMVKAEAVRQVFTALVRYRCDRAMVVTNSSFSRPAKMLADDNNCILIDRDLLTTWIVDFSK